MLKGLTLFLISNLLAITLTVAIFGTSMQVLLYPSVYQKALDKNNVYNLIEEKAIQGGYISEAVFNKQNPKKIIDYLLRNTLAYLRGDTETLNLTINLNETLYAFFEERAAEYPVCKHGQLPFSGASTVCRPPDLNVSQFLDMTLERQNVSVSKLSTVNLAEVMNKNGNITQVRDGIVIFKKIVIAAWLLSFALLMMIIMLTKKSFKSMTHWIDMDLISVGVGFVLPGLLLKDKISQLVSMQLPFLEGFLTDIIFAVINTMMYYGWFLLGAAFVLMIISFFFKDKKAKKKKIAKKKNKK
jgi:hypothetical protein